MRMAVIPAITFLVMMPITTLLVLVTFTVFPIGLAARSRRSDGHPVGEAAGGHSHGGRHRVSGRVDNRDAIGALIRNVGRGPVRGDGHPKGDAPNGHGGYNCVAGRVDHRDAVRAVVRDIGKGPVWSDG